MEKLIINTIGKYLYFIQDHILKLLAAVAG